MNKNDETRMTKPEGNLNVENCVSCVGAAFGISSSFDIPASSFWNGLQRIREGLTSQ